MKFVAFLLAALSGIACLQHLPDLALWRAWQPVAWAAMGLAGIGLWLCRQQKAAWLAVALAALLGFAGGFAYAGWRAQARLAEWLPSAWQGQDIALSGRIDSLPARFSGGVRFEFAVETVKTPQVSVPPRILLTFYDNAPPDVAFVPLSARLRAGQRHAFTVRLKRPRGDANPGGFDYAAWLLEKHLGATGTVRAKAPMTLLSDDPVNLSGQIHRLRETIRGHFRAILGDSPQAGLLIALAIGDQKAISPEGWGHFNRTGTTHLMSISGLHVSLIALWFGFLVNLLWRRVPRLCLWCPAQLAALWLGVAAAVGYALLAGFGIPAQRAVWMLTVAALAVGSGRHVGAGRALALALGVVLLADPWAVLAPGFWLSFGAVAALLWGGLALPEEAKTGRWAAVRRFFQHFSRAQWAATLSTLPLLLALFGRFPVMAPLANLVAIPLVSLVLTPLVLLSALLCLIAEPLAAPWLWVAQALAQALASTLAALADLPQWLPPQAPGWTVALAAAGAFWILLPARVPGKIAALVALLPLVFWPAPRVAPGDLRLTMLDVGQGQAIVLETARHAVLYDAGPAYPGGADAAGQTILPYLARRGIGRVSALIVSHRDVDHAGGLTRLLAGLPVETLYGSWTEEEGSPGTPPMRLCRAGVAWDFDGVRFEFLHPPSGQMPSGKNGDSCVLKITTASGRAVLTGDIGKAEEHALLADAALRRALSAELLTMPHHGSRHSASLPFLAAVGPRWSLASAGYKNRFGHPHPDTLARHQALGITVRRTDLDGALIASFSGGQVEVEGFRQLRRRYWLNAE
ncbi:MAG: DNA internalization-related competence protein ComEC/Rec2 [Zoogloeaceae bacterium]|nr:DNA internalization-related competence protein ComEC/Rec2 [Zoogloeaceae bacterium]